MIISKYMSRIVAVVLCFCLFACGFIVYAANTFDTSRTPEYQKRLFGDEVISLEIHADADDWQEMINDAQAKEWVSADIIINGVKFSTVGVRAKGNSSLSMMSGSNDRYSLQFKANKYIKGQTFFGLDTFCINNMTGDATYMKDYISYEIMDYVGVETPLKNFANVTVNGENYGFCIALERYDKSFLARVYSTAEGQLYNVKISMGRRGDFEDMWQNVENGMPNRQRGGGMGFGDMRGGDMQGGDMQGGNMQGGDMQGGDMRGGDMQGGNMQGGDMQGGDMRGGDMQGGDMQGGDMQGGNMQGGGFRGGGFGGGSGGGSLVYTDDNTSSYSAIFDNAIFNSSDKDKERLITALEKLNEGTDLEKYVDVDAVLRYFAAHTVVVNLDSYISNMQQNYYLYERDGKITILPWDYNLAFGGFQSGNASGVVNFPIDTPVSGVSMEDRPLLNKLLEVDEYLERYHGYLRQIVEGYFESGRFENTIMALDTKINQFVKNDTTSFSTYDQYVASLPVFIELGRLRAESIKGQLDGLIPSTSSAQNADSSSLVDASGVNLSTLGSMMGGGGMRQGGWQGEQNRIPNENGQSDAPEGQSGGNVQGGAPEGQSGGNVQGGASDWQQGGRGAPGDRQGGMRGGGMVDIGIDMSLMQQAMQILSDSGGELTEESRAELLELGLTEEQIEMFAQMQNRFRGRGNMQGGGGAGGMDGGNGGNGGNGNGGVGSGGAGSGGVGSGGAGVGGAGAGAGGADGVNVGAAGQAGQFAGNGAQGINRTDLSTGGIYSVQNSNNIVYFLIVGVLLVLLAGAIIIVARPRKTVI